MFQRVIVPVDGSPEARRAVEVAARMATSIGGAVEVVTVVDRLADVHRAEHMLYDGLVALGDLPVAPRAEVLASDTVARGISHHLDDVDDALVVMSSHGHGRSAAVLGSSVDELLRRIHGPIVVVGPNVGAGAGRVDGRYLVPVDGSPEAELAVPIAESWATEFRAVPWLVEWIGRVPAMIGGDVFESAYASRLASHMRHNSHRIEYDILHGPDAADAIVDYAIATNPSLVFMTTHGRSGLQRLIAGSVAADLIRRVRCPVIVYRPPHLVGW